MPLVRWTSWNRAAILGRECWIIIILYLACGCFDGTSLGDATGLNDVTQYTRHYIKKREKHFETNTRVAPAKPTGTKGCTPQFLKKTAARTAYSTSDQNDVNFLSTLIRQFLSLICSMAVYGKLVLPGYCRAGKFSLESQSYKSYKS